MYAGAPVARLLGGLACSFVGRFGFYALALPLFFEALIRRKRPALVYASTSRMWQVRAVCRAAMRNQVGVLDIQALNVLRHPKYRAPAATAVAVIDDLAREIHESYLEVPAGDIFVTGTPRVDRIRDETRSVSKVEASLEIGIVSTDRPHIMFASQVQPIERCASILRQLCAVCVKHDCNLIIRLHPREGQSRIQTYERMIREHHAGGRAVINSSTPIERVLAASDIVVTMFSNVAREALIAGKHVIIANYFDTDLPLRFDLEGATGAYSETELFSRVEEAVLRLAGREESLSDYFVRNPHLRSGRSEKAIVALGRRLSGPAGKAEPPTEWPAIGPDALPLFPFEELLAMAMEQARAGRARLAADSLRVLCAGAKEPAARQKLLAAVLHLLGDSESTGLLAMGVIARLVAGSPAGAVAELAYSAATELGHDAPALSALIAFVDGDAATPESPALQLFAAVLLAASGSLFEAKARLEALQLSKPGIPQDVLDNELKLISAVGFDLQPALRLSEPVFIIDAEADASLAQEWLRAHPGSTAYLDGAVPPSAEEDDRIVPFTQVLGDHSPELPELIEQTAVRFARDTLEAVRGLPGLGEDVRESMRDHETAFVAYLRVKMIDPARRAYSIAKILHSERVARDERPIVVLAGNAQFVRYFLQYSSDPGLSRRIFFFPCVRDRRGQELIRSVPAEGARDAGPRSGGLDSELAGVADYLTACYAGADALTAAPPAACCLFVVRSSLKTVAQTVEALLERRPSDIYTIVMSGDGASDDAAFLKGISRVAQGPAGGPLRAITAGALAGGAVVAPLDDKALAPVWRLCSGSPGLVACGLDLRPFGYSALDGFLRRSVPALFQRQKTIEKLLKSAGRAVVAVTPGRHAEALMAQSVARRYGVRSIDIQNAYMSSGYTYTRPDGDVVTAIDQWSAELMTRHFGVNPASVRKVGTPRFDGLAAKLREESATGHPEIIRSFAVPGRKLVCLATQPGSVDKCLRILRLMGQARPASGAFNALIKLHPRESDRAMARYRKAIDDGGFEGEFRVARDVDMHDVLAASDVVITIFSNVGVEAALMDKKLIVANLDREPLPLPLDEFEIGLNAYSDEDFVSMLRDLLDETGDFELLKARRARYFRDNAHLLEGRSTDRIWSIIRENLRLPQAEAVEDAA
jgi:CDP-glycerol glycerophosphotransferase (TagB/SpsB family)